MLMLNYTYCPSLEMAVVKLHIVRLKLLLYRILRDQHALLGIPF